MSLLKVKKISISIARTLLYPYFCLFSKPSACIISFLFYRHPQAALYWNQTPGLSCPNSQEPSNEKPAVLPQLILRTTLRLVLLSKARCLRKTCDCLLLRSWCRRVVILTTQLYCFLQIPPRSALQVSTCGYESLPPPHAPHTFFPHWVTVTESVSPGNSSRKVAIETPNGGVQ